MSIIYHNQMIQGSNEWLLARCGIVTASELDSLVTPLWKVKDGAAVESYVAFKLAEKWLGYAIQTFSGANMDQGKIRESEAIPAYVFQFDRDIQRVGLVVSGDGLIGASPDGMFYDGSGIEIKCPEPQKHTLYLLANECPKEYRHQVQGSMYVCGSDHWEFLSYCRDFPVLRVVVERDEKAMQAIAEAVALFHERFSAGWDRLVEANGGEPVRISQNTSATPLLDEYFETDWTKVTNGQ